MARRSANEFARYMKTSATDLAVIPLGVVVTLAVGNAAFQASRNLMFHPEVKINVNDKSNMFGAPTADELEKRSKEHALHAVRKAATASYHADLQRYGIEESLPNSAANKKA
jgi:hypothetical protein